MSLENFFTPFIIGSGTVAVECLNECTLNYFIDNVNPSLPAIEEIARVAVSPSLVPRIQRYAFVDCAFTLGQIVNNPIASRYFKMPGFFVLQARKHQMLWTMREVAYLREFGIDEFISKFGLNEKEHFETGDTTRTIEAIESRHKLLTTRQVSDKSGVPRHIPDKSSGVKPKVLTVYNGMPAWFNKEHAAGVDHAKARQPTTADLRTWRAKVADEPGEDITR